MKLIKTAKGITKISMTYVEWKRIGEEQGWFEKIDQAVERRNRDFRNKMVEHYKKVLKRDPNFKMMLE